MQWALVATQTQPLTIYVSPVLDNNNVIVSQGYFNSIQASIGTILNIIVYDGLSEYVPDSGMKLIQVPDDAKIGDTGY